MPLIEYQIYNFRKRSRLLVDIANGIISEYQEAGYDLTLRQLYYQFVARDIIPNNQKEYDKLGVLISKARLAGLIDWNAIIDRTRTSRSNSHFTDPGDILSTAAETYKLDTRADQDSYIEVWVEKEALIGVIEPVCRELDVRYLACKGYLSQSAMWAAAHRIIEKNNDDQKAVVLYLGDHDPSGLDMTRDIKDRLALFDADVEVIRLALNMAQIEQYSPPPNFAKQTDTRCKEYIAAYGRNSWELDALEPKVIAGLIRKVVVEFTDEDKRQELIKLEGLHKQRLAYISDNWEEIDPQQEGNRG